MSPCLSAVAVWPCARCRSPQAKTGGRWPGLDHYRRTLQAKTTGPARPPIWPGLVGYIGDFWPCVIFGPVGPLFCPVAGFLRPCGDLSRLDLCGASGGLLWAVVGWVGIACGPAVSIWGGRRARFILSACPAFPVSACARLPVWACLTVGPCLPVSALLGLHLFVGGVLLWCGVSPPLQGKRKTALCGVVSPWVVWWCL